MPDIIGQSYLGAVLLIEHYPYRFPVLLLMIAIIGGCIFAPVLRDKRKDDDD